MYLDQDIDQCYPGSRRIGMDAPTINRSLLLTKNFEQTDFTGLFPAAPAAFELVTCANVVVVAYVTGLYRLTVKYSARLKRKTN